MQRTLNDLWYSWLVTQLSSGIVNGTSDPVAGSGSSGGGGSSIAYENTVSNAGVVTAPGANAAIVTLAKANLPEGKYQIQVQAGYGASAEAAADNNINVRAGATVVGRIVAFGANTIRSFMFYYDLDGDTDLTVNAISAGSAGSVYVAYISATRIGDVTT